MRDSALTSSARVARIFTTLTQRIANSRIEGLTTGVGTTVCFDNFDANYAPVTCTA